MTRRDNRGSATPLLDWGEQLRATKHKRRILGRRVTITGIGITLLARGHGERRGGEEERRRRSSRA